MVSCSRRTSVDPGLVVLRQGKVEIYVQEYGRFLILPYLYQHFLLTVVNLDPLRLTFRLCHYLVFEFD